MEGVSVESIENNNNIQNNEDYIKIEITNTEENESISPIFSEGKLKRIIKPKNKDEKTVNKQNNKDEIKEFEKHPHQSQSQLQKKINDIIENLSSKNELIKKLINLIHHQKETEMIKNQKHQEKELLLEEFTLKNQIQDKEIKNFKSQISILQKNLKEKENEKNDTIKELEEIIEEKDKELKNLSLQKTMNIKTQESSSKELQTKINEFNRLIQKLEDEKNELKKEIIEKDNLHLNALDEISVERMKKNELQLESQSLEKKIAEKNEFIRKLQEKVIHYEEEVNKINHNFDEQYYKIQELEAKIRKHVENEDLLEKKMKEQEKKTLKILKEKEDLVEELNDLEKSNLKLSSSLTNANNLIEKKTSLIERMKSDNSIVVGVFGKDVREKEEEFLLNKEKSNLRLDYKEKEELKIIKETDFIIISLKTNTSILDDFNSIMNEENDNGKKELKKQITDNTETETEKTNKTPMLIGKQSFNTNNISNENLNNDKVYFKEEREIEETEKYNKLNLKYKNYSKPEESDEDSIEDGVDSKINSLKIQELEMKVESLTIEMDNLYKELEKEQERNTNLLSIKETLEENLKQEIENFKSQEKEVSITKFIIIKVDRKNRRLKQKTIRRIRLKRFKRDS